MTASSPKLPENQLGLIASLKQKACSSIGSPPSISMTSDQTLLSGSSHSFVGGPKAGLNPKGLT